MHFSKCIVERTKQGNLWKYCPNTPLCILRISVSVVSQSPRDGGNCRDRINIQTYSIASASCTHALIPPRATIWLGTTSTSFIMHMYILHAFPTYHKLLSGVADSLGPEGLVLSGIFLLVVAVLSLLTAVFVTGLLLVQNRRSLRDLQCTSESTLVKSVM